LKLQLRLLCVLLSGILLLSGCSSTGFQAKSAKVSFPEASANQDLNNKTVDHFIPCAQKGDLSLYVKPSNAEFYVETADGMRWYSNPPERGEDTVASGTYRSELSSQLVIRYFNPVTGENSSLSTMSDSVYDQLFEILAVPDGFCTKYSFRFFKTEEGADEPSVYEITIPLYVYISDGRLKAEVGVSQIENGHPDMFLYNISLLPFFGAGGSQDEGYLMVPDGSGALIEFNQGRDFASGFSRPVYGAEPTILRNGYDLTVEQQDIRLPVFGVKVNGAAYLAVIEEGCQESTVNAWGNMQVTSYSNVYADFAIREKMDYSIGNVNTSILEKGSPRIPKIGVSYEFLSGSDAGYGGMARAYREHLIEKYTLMEKAEPAALFVELYAGVRKQVSNLGVQSDTVIPLTDTGRVETIANALSERGVDNVVFSYRSWSKHELSGKPQTSAAMQPTLQSGDIDVRRLTQSQDFLFYPLFSDVLSFSNIGFIGRNVDTVCNLSGVTVRPRRYLPGLGSAEGEVYYFLTVGKIGDHIRRLKSSISNADFKTAAFSDIGQLLYNDYRGDGAKRGHTQTEITAAMKTVSGDLRTMLYYPNEYALQFASDIFGLPSKTSDHDIIDRSVPFYQIAISGLIRYSGQPLNNSNAGSDALLKTIEAGGCPAYTWIYEPAEALRDTGLSGLSGCHYTLTLDQATEEYKAAAQIERATGGSRLYDHQQVTSGVFVSIYENGARVYVNYTYDSYQAADGTVVDAKSYAVKGGAS